MNEYEKYFFDLNGYLVVEDVLTVDELAKLNESIDQNQEQIQIRSAEQTLSRGSTALVGKQGRGDLGGMLTWPKPWCEPFRALLDHERILPYLLDLLQRYQQKL